MNRTMYLHLLLISNFIPVLIAMVAALLTPQQYKWPAIKTAFFLILILYSILGPLRMMYVLYSVYSSDGSNFSGSVSNVFMSLMSSHTSFLMSLVISLANALIRAVLAVFGMMIVFWFKRVISGGKEDGENGE